MARDLLEEKRKKRAQRMSAALDERQPNQSRDLLAEKRARTQQPELSASLPVIDNENQEASNASTLERLVQQFPRLAQAIGGMELPEGVKKAGQLAGKINEYIESSGIPSAAGGLLQGAGNTLISAANLPLGLADTRIPHLDLKQYAEPGLINSAMFGVGDVLGQIGGGAGALGLLGKAGQALNIPRQTGLLGLGSQIAKPALAGYITGENAEGDNYGRLLSAIIGGAGGAINALRPGAISSDVIKSAEESAAKGSQMYTSLLKDAEGIKASRTPNIDTAKIKQAVPKSYTKSLDAALANPTVENIHRAQSDLGKWTAKTNISSKTPSETIRAYDAAIEAQKKLRGTLFQALSKSGDKTLAPRYAEATRNWAEHSEIFNSKPAQKIKKKAAEKLAEALFREKFPAYGISESLSSNKILKQIGLPASSAALGTGLALKGTGIFKGEK